MSTYDNFVVEDHPFEPFIPSGAKVLIVGSFPTHKRNYKMTFKFFYAGLGNMFWPVMEKVFDRKFQYNSGDLAIKERKDLLTQRKVGLTDMLIKCYRNNGRSQDEHIFPIKFADIFRLLDAHPEIETIILTGRQRVIGPRGLFETYFYQHDLIPPVFKEHHDKILTAEFVRDKRHFEVLVPYSPSNTVIEQGRTSESELVKMYSYCLK